ncbi:nitrous oxide reductase accessory protein NosL [Candidatus Venteria ishoeyi]|uniref:NosL n=1 Tax=Candidatus Venteria ishoeyi TaxID=1899563 RepID=A0A1H6FFY8_9GAMM|nr:nitrous oxide reductase accessory protein NosL [Candidatus Venteria ishoeyi]SEH08990.1 NosL [Candidatus Venteria ishoeyi]
MKSVHLLLTSCLFLVLFVTGCSDRAQTGPEKIHWDRDACERCRMVVSDRNFTAQLRGGPDHKIFKFDDLGCALHWLKKQTWAEDKKTEIWVTDYQTGEWLDAYKAFYVGGLTTPMDYDLGAIAKAVEGAIDFSKAKAQILATKHSHGGH